MNRVKTQGGVFTPSQMEHTPSMLHIATGASDRQNAAASTVYNNNNSFKVTRKKQNLKLN